jgi:hypothetical protein
MGNFFKELDSMTPFNKEVLNFCLSMLVTIALTILLLFGVEADGTFKNETVRMLVESILSVTGMNLVLFCLIPMFLLTLFKAYLFDAPKYIAFDYVAQFVTGTFYSFGSCIMALCIISTTYGYYFDLGFFILGCAIFFIGFGLYQVFQAMIQRKLMP